MYMTLTKADFVDSLVAEINGLTKNEAKEIVDLMFEELKAAFERGEEVKISGFGNFNLRDKGERPGRNPKTGEEEIVSARRVVTFRAGQKLKKVIESYNADEPNQ